MALMPQSNGDSGIFSKKVASVKACLAIPRPQNPRRSPRRRGGYRGTGAGSGDFYGQIGYAVVAVVVAPTDLLTSFLLLAAEMPPKKNRLNTTVFV